MHLNIFLRRLGDQQINYQMTKKLSDMICLPINYYLVKKKSINFIFYIESSSSKGDQYIQKMAMTMEPS